MKVVVEPPYPGSRPTRDGGTLRWSTGDFGATPPLGFLTAFIDAGRTQIDQAQRRAAIHRTLRKAEEGKLIMKSNPEKYHDVAPIVSNPHLLEFRWRFTEHDADGHEVVHRVRAYFDEPSDAPSDMRILHAHEKTTTDEQNNEIALAEKVRVEGTEFT